MTQNSIKANLITAFPLRCDCCGKSNLKKAYKIESDELETVTLGATCITKHFNVNMTGNKFGARDRLQAALNNMRHSAVEEILYDACEGLYLD